MQAAERINLAVKQGTTLRFCVLCTLDGVAQDITGDTVVFVAKTDKKLPDTGASILTSADVTTEGADGRAIVSLTPTLTNIGVRQYFWDATWTTAAGDVYVRVEGEIGIQERVSDA